MFEVSFLCKGEFLVSKSLAHKKGGGVPVETFFLEDIWL